MARVRGDKPRSSWEELSVGYGCHLRIRSFEGRPPTRIWPLAVSCRQIHLGPLMSSTATPATAAGREVPTFTRQSPAQKPQHHRDVMFAP